jgi:hypothetical protein
MYLKSVEQLKPLKKPQNFGRCEQVNTVVKVDFEWLLAIVDRWSLFRGKCSPNISWAVSMMAVVLRWPLITVAVNTGLTVLRDLSNETQSKVVFDSQKSFNI